MEIQYLTLNFQELSNQLFYFFLSQRILHNKDNTKSNYNEM